MNTYLAADLGGTKLLVGEVTQSGEILRSRAYPTGPLTQRDALEKIRAALGEFLSEGPRNIRAIGLGLVGRVDSQQGLWPEISQERKDPVNIRADLESAFHLPVFPDNDVRSALKAELLFGKGRGLRDLIYLNVGTGIAAGFVSGGHIITGGHCNAGEIGHISSGLPFRIPCACGREDCVESLASGAGLDQCARALRDEYPDTALVFPAQGRVSAGDIFRLSATDPLCQRLTRQAAQALANLLMNLVRFNDPEAIVLGGGVVADGFLLRQALALVKPHPIRFVSAGISLTDLNPKQIGLLGAASNAIIGMEEPL